MSEDRYPLLTVGIPTYNRADSLAVAVASVLIQDYPRLEVVISDNASSDGTTTLLATLVAGDERIRVLRQEENIGAIRNYEAVLRAASGELFLWLADDDQLSEGYAARCVEHLLDHPEVACAVGLTTYLRGGRHHEEAERVEVRGSDPEARVLAFFRTVWWNPAIYGVMRTEDLRRAGVFEQALAWDWLCIGAIAALGEIHTVPEAAMFRSADGISGDTTAVVRAIALPAWTARVEHLWVAWTVMRMIQTAPAFDEVPLGRRRLLSLRSALAVVQLHIVKRRARNAVVNARRRWNRIRRLRWRGSRG